MLTLAVVVVAAIAVYVVTRDLIRGYWTAYGARIEHYTLHSRYVHQPLHEIRVVPARHGDWTLVLLHGRSSSPSAFLDQPFFDAIHSLGPRAPVVLLLDGGDHSYWHNRADGKWGSMVLREAIPRHGHVAIGGISMGGYGALLLGAQGHFCAIGGHSPALWFRGADSAPGAFDDTADFARHDLIAHPPRYRAPVWIDVGTQDPFHSAAVYFAHEIHAQLHVWPGGHDGSYWGAHMHQYFSFYAAHCA